MKHFGLTFNEEQVVQANKNRNRTPMTGAWDYLATPAPEDPMPSAQWYGLRYRFENDQDAAKNAMNLLMQGIPSIDDAFSQITQIFVAIHAFEMTRDYSAFASNSQQWLKSLSEWIGYLNSTADNSLPINKFWLGTVNIAAGIALEDESIFQLGTDSYKQAINTEVHPDGYIKAAVESKTRDSLLWHILALNSLVLSAEMASHAGVDLWSYNDRGVSVTTATAYIIYYYYYPERWIWYEGYTPDDTIALFRQYGAFMEIINRQAKLRAVDPMLDEQRPMYSPISGGITTLTHLKQKRRWLFG